MSDEQLEPVVNAIAEPTALDRIRAEQKSASPGKISYQQRGGDVVREVAIASKRRGGVNR